MKNGNPDQFKLFMTGVEWQDQITHSTDGPIDTVWQEKELRSRLPKDSGHGSGVYDSMAKDGYVGKKSVNSQPSIVIEDSPSGKSTRMVQSEGHHRVAAAAAVERETGKPVYIPTNYFDNSKAGRKARHR